MPRPGRRSRGLRDPGASPQELLELSSAVEARRRGPSGVSSASRANPSISFGLPRAPTQPDTTRWSRTPPSARGLSHELPAGSCEPSEWSP